MVFEEVESQPTVLASFSARQPPSSQQQIGVEPCRVVFIGGRAFETVKC